MELHSERAAQDGGLSGVASMWDSIRPAGPAPTIPTRVLILVVISTPQCGTRLSPLGLS